MSFNLADRDRGVLLSVLKRYFQNAQEVINFAGDGGNLELREAVSDEVGKVEKSDPGESKIKNAAVDQLVRSAEKAVAIPWILSELFHRNPFRVDFWQLLRTLTVRYNWQVEGDESITPCLEELG